MTALDDARLAQWRAQGWICFDELLPRATLAQLPGWVDAVSRPVSDPSQQRLHYYEQTDQGPALCRTERYLEDHEGLRQLVTRGVLTETAGALLGEDALIYKEKINFKAPGGAGFAAHQDASAYRFVNHHITCLVAVDEMNPDNGCLEFARGSFDGLLPAGEDGCLDVAIAQRCQWTPVAVPPGGVVYFHSLVPHRSGPNRSGHARRALYLTYNGCSESDQRARYYAQRAQALAQAPAGSNRISTIGHFKGRPVDPAHQP